MPATIRAAAVAIAIVGSMFDADCFAVVACWVMFWAMVWAWFANVSACCGSVFISCWACEVRFMAWFSCSMSWFVSAPALYALRMAV